MDARCEGTDPRARTIASDTALASTRAPREATSGIEATLAAGLGGDTTLRIVAPDQFVDRIELKRGGMGRILTAHDPRLGRTVAIKELRADSPELRARFEREVRLTARLEHPSIVGIHEAGRWPSGEPFFAMRLVRGRSLDEAIAATSSFAERIALVPNVLAVADALAFAHHERVIHRDLKPHNVMVGDFGETVVIDWGLAKDLGDTTPDPRSSARRFGGDAAETTDGEILGTPHYMPPEQAEGLAVDERADVYAIGAMLYHVLAGTTPYQGKTTAAILEAVTTTPPAPLASLATAVPPDLIAIVERAMARDPEARYRTARELADDLRRFHSGQLVGAHRYSLSQLLRRWLAKHRAAVTVAAISVGVLGVLGAIGVQRIVDEQHHAVAARDLADRSRTDAEELLQFMVYDLSARLAPLGKLDVLDTVVRKARSYYERQPGALDARAQEARATARHQLGRILVDQNDSAGALVEFRAALAIIEEVRRTRPGNLELARMAMLLHRSIGDVHVRHGKLDEVVAEHRASLELATWLATLAPGDPRAQADRAVAHGRLGDALEARGDLAGAVAAFRASRDVLLGVVRAHPEQVRSQRQLSSAHDRIAIAHRQQGDFAAALAEHEAGKTIAEMLLARDPDNAELQRDLMVSHSLIGEVLLLQGKAPAALLAFRAQLALTETLSAQDLTNADARRDLAISHLKIGEVLELQHDRAALTSYRAALAISASLAAQNPADTLLARDVAVTHNKLGSALLPTDPAGALGAYRAAQAIVIPLATREPTNVGWQFDLAIGHTRMGEALAATGDRAGAELETRAGLAIMDKLVAVDPTNRDWATQLEMLRAKLAPR